MILSFCILHIKLVRAGSPQKHFVCSSFLTNSGSERQFLRSSVSDGGLVPTEDDRLLDNSGCKIVVNAPLTWHSRRLKEPFHCSYGYVISMERRNLYYHNALIRWLYQVQRYKRLLVKLLTVYLYLTFICICWRFPIRKNIIQRLNRLQKYGFRTSLLYM